MSLIIWVFSLFLKYRILFSNIYTVTIWGMIPSIVLLAIGTFYIRILNTNTDFVIIGLGLAIMIYLLCIYRILKGTHIIFDQFFLKVYSYGFLTILLIAGTIWIFMNNTRLFFDYFDLVTLFLKQ
jgi:hypothetical protein